MDRDRTAGHAAFGLGEAFADDPVTLAPHRRGERDHRQVPGNRIDPDIFGRAGIAARGERDQQEIAAPGLDEGDEALARQRDMLRDMLRAQHQVPGAVRAVDDPGKPEAGLRTLGFGKAGCGKEKGRR